MEILPFPYFRHPPESSFGKNFSRGFLPEDRKRRGKTFKRNIFGKPHTKAQKAFLTRGAGPFWAQKFEGLWVELSGGDTPVLGPPQRPGHTGTHFCAPVAMARPREKGWALSLERGARHPGGS